MLLSCSNKLIVTNSDLFTWRKTLLEKEIKNMFGLSFLRAWFLFVENSFVDMPVNKEWELYVHFTREVGKHLWLVFEENVLYFLHLIIFWMGRGRNLDNVWIFFTPDPPHLHNKHSFDLNFFIDRDTRFLYFWWLFHYIQIDWNKFLFRPEL